MGRLKDFLGYLNQRRSVVQQIEDHLCGLQAKYESFFGEVAQAHDGSLGMAHAYIDAIAEAGADAVKFQTHIASAESTSGEPWRIKFSPQDATRYDYWRRMEFTEPQWCGLRQHAEAERLDRDVAGDGDIIHRERLVERGALHAREAAPGLRDREFTGGRGVHTGDGRDNVRRRRGPWMAEWYGGGAGSRHRWRPAMRSQPDATGDLRRRRPERNV